MLDKDEKIDNYENNLFQINAIIPMQDNSDKFESTKNIFNLDIGELH